MTGCLMLCLQHTSGGSCCCICFGPIDVIQRSLVSLWCGSYTENSKVWICRPGGYRKRRSMLSFVIIIGEKWTVVGDNAYNYNIQL